MKKDVEARETTRRALLDGADLRTRMVEASTDSIVHAAALIIDSLEAGGKLLLFGNGGSAADAQHIAAEFGGRFQHERRPLPALALTTDTSILTAVSNDYGFEHVFARQVAAVGRPGDIALAISTSGASPNVLAAAGTAQDSGIKVIALTGKGGGDLAPLADLAIVVPSRNTQQIQEAHIAIGHILSEIVETALMEGH